MIFRNWILENFPFLEDDFDALTDYQLFSKMVEYMKKSLEKVNSFQKDIDEFSAKLNDFQHYFDNLDVTEEVNAKLDDMVESGEMAEIIAEYLSLTTVFAYSTLEELKQADNLSEGALIQTYGRLAVNDGGGAKYYVRAVTTDDVIDDMFIIELADNRYVAQYLVENNQINIKQMGCHGTYGDHSFNNSTIMQTLINYAESKGTILFIPNGFYGFEETLYINNNIIIKGAGTPKLWSGNANGPILYFNKTDRPFIHINKSSTLYNWDYDRQNLVENVHLSGFMIDGTNDGVAGITGIYASCYLSTFKNLIIAGFKNDIALSQCYETIVDNCQFVNSYQCLVQFSCNDTTIVKNVWCNGGHHDTGSTVTDATYQAKYTKCHLFNYCGVLSHLGYIYFENLAVENSCYGIITQDTVLYIDKCHIEDIMDYCFKCNVNLAPDIAKTVIDHAKVSNGSSYSSCIFDDIGYRTRFSIKMTNRLNISNMNYNSNTSNYSIKRIYSYEDGERIIPLGLSNNVIDPVIINESHYTENGFRIKMRINGATSWGSSNATSITGIPISGGWTSDNPIFIACPTTSNTENYNLKLANNGALTTSAGNWLGGSSIMSSRVTIDYEYKIHN